MNSTPEAGAEGPGTIAARERNCYCGLWDKDPAFCQAQGYAPGHCGVCDRCGVPGHTRHFPGPLPYTGSWCDRCYRIVKWTWPFQSVGGWLLVLVALGVFLVVGYPIFAAIGRALR